MQNSDIHALGPLPRPCKKEALCRIREGRLEVHALVIMKMMMVIIVVIIAVFMSFTIVIFISSSGCVPGCNPVGPGISSPRTFSSTRRAAWRMGWRPCSKPAQADHHETPYYDCFAWNFLTTRSVGRLQGMHAKLADFGWSNVMENVSYRQIWRAGGIHSRGVETRRNGCRRWVIDIRCPKVCRRHPGAGIRHILPLLTAAFENLMPCRNS